MQRSPAHTPGRAAVRGGLAGLVGLALGLGLVGAACGDDDGPVPQSGEVETVPPSETTETTGAADASVTTNAPRATSTTGPDASGTTETTG